MGCFIHASLRTRKASDLDFQFTYFGEEDVSHKMVCFCIKIAHTMSKYMQWHELPRSGISAALFKNVKHHVGSLDLS